MYEGGYKDGMREGKGIFRWTDGEYYVGDWVCDQREGYGILYYQNGDKYEGTWKDDKKAGNGLFMSSRKETVRLFNGTRK